MKFGIQDLPYTQFEQLGMSKNDVLDMKPQDLANMLNGSRTGLLPLNIPLGEGMKPMLADVKLILSKGADNTLSLAVHPILAKPTNTIEATPEQWNRMLAGEPIVKDSRSLHGKNEPHLYQLDKQTNEILAARVKSIQIPDSIKDTTLTPDQKDQIKQGFTVKLESINSKEMLSFRLDLNQPTGYSIVPELKINSKQDNGNALTNDQKQTLNEPRWIAVNAQEREIKQGNAAGEGHKQNASDVYVLAKLNGIDRYVPDIIEGKKLDSLDKRNLTKGGSVKFPERGILYSINDKDQIVKEKLNESLSPQKSLVLTKDVSFNHTTYLLDLAPKGDPIKSGTLILDDLETIYGKFRLFEKSHDIKIEAFPGVKPSDITGLYYLRAEVFRGNGTVVLANSEEWKGVEIKDTALKALFDRHDSIRGIDSKIPEFGFSAPKSVTPYIAPEANEPSRGFKR